MHASTIENHDALTHVATNLVSAWRGTPPMTSEAQVREALTVAAEGTMADAESVDVLLPYVVDACRKEGLLVEPKKLAPVTVAKKKGKYDRSKFDSFTAWESAVSGSFGGIVRQWPEWAQAVYKAEHGYLP